MFLLTFCTQSNLPGNRFAASNSFPGQNALIVKLFWQLSRIVAHVAHAVKPDAPTGCVDSVGKKLYED